MSLFKRKELVKHDWQLIDTQVLPSMIEQLKGASMECHGFGVADKTVIQTFKCKLTDEVKIVTHVSGDSLRKPQVTNL